MDESDKGWQGTTSATTFPIHGERNKEGENGEIGKIAGASSLPSLLRLLCGPSSALTIGNPLARVGGENPRLPLLATPARATVLRCSDSLG